MSAHHSFIYRHNAPTSPQWLKALDASVSQYLPHDDYLHLTQDMNVYRPSPTYGAAHRIFRALRRLYTPPWERLTAKTQVGIVPPEDRDLVDRYPGYTWRTEGERTQLLRDLRTDYGCFYKGVLDFKSPDDLVTFVYGNVIKELYRLPEKLRTERELVQALPFLATAQRRWSRERLFFVGRGSHTLYTHFRHANHAASVLHDIHDIEIDAMSREECQLPRSRRRRPSFRSARYLHASLTGPVHEGMAGDRELSDAWAKELGLTEFYKWAPADWQEAPYLTDYASAAEHVRAVVASTQSRED